jgi:hypothetical protein
MRVCLAIGIVAFLVVVVVSGFTDDSRSGSTPLTWGQMTRVRGAATCADGCVTVTHGLCQQADTPACIMCYYSSSYDAVAAKTCPAKFDRYAGKPGKVGQKSPGNGQLIVTGTMICHIEYECDDTEVLSNQRCDVNGNCTTLNGTGLFCRSCTKGAPTGFSGTKQDDSCIKCPS